MGAQISTWNCGSLGRAHEDAGIVGVVRAEVGQEPCGVGRGSDQDREEATYLVLGVEVTVPTL